MVRRQWIRLLVIWPMILGLPACRSTEAPPFQAASPTPHPTATGEPSTVATTTVEATGTLRPSPSPTDVVPLSPTRPIPEVTVVESPTILTPSDPGLQKLVLQAREDLAGRLSIEVDQIDLVEVKAVVWPDASLGCPQPGVVYKQVPQDGALIRLRAEGRVFDYHSGGSRGPFLCERTLRIEPQAPPPAVDDR